MAYSGDKLMADRDPIWSLGESSMLYSPTSGLDADWSLGESFILDEYTAGSALNDINIFGIESIWAQSPNYR